MCALSAFVGCLLLWRRRGKIMSGEFSDMFAREHLARSAIVVTRRVGGNLQRNSSRS